MPLQTSQHKKKVFATALIVCSVLLGTAFAQTETILYSFGASPDGKFPDATPILDAKGNLYGTTSSGGAHNLGAVFKLTPGGTETVLYSFSGAPDGQSPYTSGVVRDKAGNLYGTTGGGGANGQGTVFKLTPTGTETVLHSFAADGKDGVLPIGGLVMDKLGNLYGTTNKGGTANAGTVYKVTPTGTETVLYSFTAGTADGCQPYGVTLALKKNILYGTTFGCGANGGGTVFRVTLSGTEKVLYNFGVNLLDGFGPVAGVALDKAGNLYGTTAGGGSNIGGTAFKVTQAGQETVLYAFNATETDGYKPEAPVALDKLGNLYGTTLKGGTGSGCCGTVWKLDPSGKETILHVFTGTPDGNGLSGAGVVLDKKGNLYGAAFGGGANGNGAVYKVTP